MLPLLEFGLLAREQSGDERLVLRLVHRTVEVIGAVASLDIAGTDLVVARLLPGDRLIDALVMDDRRDGVEEGERVLAGQFGDRLGECGRGERTGRHDDAVPVLGRQARDFLALQRHQRVGEQGLLHRRREAVSVDGERAAGGQLVRVGRAHDQRAGAAHLFVDHADGIVGGVVGAEGVGADQFRETVGEMGLGAAHRPHLVQHHRHARLGELPRRLAARETAADDVNGLGA